MRKLFTLFLCLASFVSFAQKPLTNSRQSSYYTYIYKLEAEEVLWFYKNKNIDPGDKILHTVVDSIKTGKYWKNRLPPGNYLKVYAEKNRLKYTLIENHSVFIKLLYNSYDQRFVFFDKRGKEISDVLVKTGNKRIALDNVSKTFQVKHSKKESIVQADYAGVSNFFILKEEGYDRDDDTDGWLAARWKAITKMFKKKETDRYNVKSKYTGFVVFNKPKYKPNDTVKFKAFILNARSKQPAKQKQLLVKLDEGYIGEGKLISTVNSYRNGGFEYSFVLNDSLKLKLDRSYAINLKDPAKITPAKNKPGSYNDNKDGDGHEFLISGRFTYEDYELKSINFNTRTEKKQHGPGEGQAIYLKATDENDLPVPDGRVRLTITRFLVNNYGAAHVFVPDTLWVHQLKLDPVGETKVIIPDTIFPKADVSYRINADLLNSSNEHLFSSNDASFHYKPYHIVTELIGDTLKASYKVFGKDARAEATITALTADDDTISTIKMTLPTKMIFNPNAYTYNIETDSTDVDIALRDSVSSVSLATESRMDSLFVKVNNPRNLHFWYTVFAGNKIIDAGEADQLYYKKAFSEAKIVTFLVNYFWAGQSKSEQAALIYRRDLLTINVKQPVSIYPSQRVRTDIVVTDAEGRSVANADLTAWSLTRKFTDYNAPQIPYIGRRFPLKKNKSSFGTDEIDAQGSMSLNWNRWSHEMGLDSIAYYQFTHTKTIYSSEEKGIDTVTQIAPFIVDNGYVDPVHILFIDEKPVYFSQAQHLQQYSFRVSPGKHSLKFRTSHQLIKLDSVWVQRSKKLILGINASYLPSTKVSDTLTNYEADQINKYLITVIDNFDQQQALIKQGNDILFLNPQPGKYQSILTGPLSDNYSILDVRGDRQRAFNAEPGYSYFFEPNLLKQKSIATAYPFNKVLSSSAGTDDLRQYAMTQARADSIWQDYLDTRANEQVLFVDRFIRERSVGKLIIERPWQSEEKTVFIKNIIVYRYDDPDYTRIYRGNASDLGDLSAGAYRLLFLLKGDNYDIKENVIVKPNGINYYKLNITSTHTKDPVSTKISAVINGRPGAIKYSDDSIENDALKIKEAFNDKYFNTGSFNGTMTGTIVGSDNKLPVVGANVRIKGTSMGTTTDLKGHFKISVPASGILVVTFIGYQTQEIQIKDNGDAYIKLDPSSAYLRDVVVVGYAVQRKRDVTGSISRLLQGRVAGINIVEAAGAPGGGVSIQIRGVSSVAGQEPLYIVDGEIVSGLNGIQPSSITEVNVLKAAAATALYGARAANGVVIITTKKEKAADGAAPAAAQPADEQTLRKNFSDYAYWQPKLTTDDEGKASFTTVFPDDITNWRTFVMGINGNRQSGSVEHQIKSFKILSASFLSPQFAVQGDELSALGKVSNYGTDAAKLSRSFTYNGKLLKQDSLTIKNSKIDTLTVTATNTDSLTFEYTIKRDNGYFDGERRKIPVVEQGIKETKGVFEALNGDTTVTMQFDPAMGPVTFRAEASVLPTLMEEARKLREYKYLCNEQLASKLEGLLTEKRIKASLGEAFVYDKNIRGVIKKLQENRRTQGTWGWWKDTDEELWVSLHVVNALTDAMNDGFSVQLDQQKLTDYLVYQLESYKGEDKLTCLQLLHKLAAKVDHAKYFAVIERENTAFKAKTPAFAVSTYDKFRLILLKQEAGMPVKLDSLLAMQHRTLFGNTYWGEDNYRFFDNSVQLSILAYKIIKNEGKHPELLAKIRGYFLEQRKQGEWRNTYESALILETILPDVLTDNKKVKPSTLTLTGAKTETITQFPYTATISDKQLRISKTGSLPIYVTGYQQFWNSKPEKVSKDFTVDTWFEKKGEKLTQLKGGEPIQLKAEITAKGDADFVMIEIPIPAGCSYESKEQSWQNNEVHREYFKEKVSIFCRKLKQGKYEFSISLLPRYSGKYNLNPAKAEMMYFPVFYGREGMRKVVVGD